MNRKHRITRNTDFKRVRSKGRSTAHPLVVLVTLDDAAENSRVGIITSKTVGKAVQRNRVRRQLRAILSGLLPKITKNVDILLIARKPILNADFNDIRNAVIQLLIRAKCLENHDNS